MTLPHQRFLPANRQTSNFLGERGGAMESAEPRQHRCKAKWKTFQVSNMAMDHTAQMIVVKLDEQGQQFVVDPASEKVDEAGCQRPCESLGPESDGNRRTDTDLEAGRFNA